MTNLTRSILPTALVACGLFAFVGCGEVLSAQDAGDNTPDAGGVDSQVDIPDAMPVDPCAGDVKPADLSSCFIEAICTTMNRCYGTFDSVEDCVNAGGPIGRGGGRAEAGGSNGGGGDTFVVMLQRLVDNIGAGTVTYDGNLAGDCLAELTAISCPNLYFDGDPTRSPSCKATFTGQVAQDGTCYDQDECLGTNAGCYQPKTPCEEQCCPGTCDLSNTLGNVCDDNYRCEEGAYCVSGDAGTSPMCQNGELNAPCWSYGECDEGFWCDFPVGTSGTRGLCKADFNADDGCTEDAQCPRPQRCVGNDLSVTNPLGMCAPVHTEGAACDGRCDGPFYCDWPDSSVTGVCTPYPDLNEDCSMFSVCRGQLWCDQTDQKCKAPRTSGVTCTGTNQCGAPLFCTTEVGVNPGSCRAPQANGNLCNSGYHCDTGVCAGNTATPGIFQCTDYGSCQ